jgi:hypothetical protein
MGVADNLTYKDQYFFKTGPYYNSTFGENPSLDIEDSINHTIKSNPYRANVEIEGREVVLNPQLDGIFDAKGKRHHQGGMPVQLEPGSFVFSDDKTLSLTESDHDLFELKSGSGFKKVDNTPAKVLKRNIDLKHYNTLVTNLKDPKKNMLAKSSSELMLKKYQEALGKIAFVQEDKKGFPDGIPEFAQGSAPVYKDEVKEEIMTQKQYARYGGYINNPYKKVSEKGLTMMQTAGTVTETTTLPPSSTNIAVEPPDNTILEGDQIVPYEGDKYGTFENSSIFEKDYWYQFAKDVGFVNYFNKEVRSKDPNARFNNKTFQKWLSENPETADIVRTIHEGKLNEKGEPFIRDGKVFTKYGLPAYTGKIIDGMLGIRWDDVANEWYKRKTNKPKDPENKPTEYIPPPELDTNIEINPQNYYPIKTQLTPWQKASLAYSISRALNIEAIPPMRSQFEPRYASRPLYNPEPMVQDTMAMTNQAIQALNTLSPIQRNALASDMIGKSIDQVNRIRADYDNRNVGQKTDEDSTNIALRNQSALQNIQFDQQYYREVAQTIGNKLKLKQAATDMAMSELFQDISMNQTLAYQLATLRNPAWTFDFKTGNFKRLPKSILDAYSSNAKGAYLDQYIKQIDFNTLSPSDKIQFLKVLTLKGFEPQVSKRGGVIKNQNPYR